MLATVTRSLVVVATLVAGAATADEVKVFQLPEGAGPHDVAPAPDGRIWYSAQGSGALGIIDPATGAVRQVPLGEGSAPHGVIQGPDGAAWLTDGGLNAIVRVDPRTDAVKVWPLPEDAGYANLNTATFDRKGTLWFTGQAGIYGSLDPATGSMRVWKDPDGPGPYGITTTPDGRVFYASLAGSHIAEIDTATGDEAPDRPADGGPGGATRMGRQQGRHLGQRVEQRAAQPLHAGQRRLAGLEAAGGHAARLRGLRRRRRHGLGQRLRRQRGAVLRPRDRAVHGDLPG